VCVYVCVHTSVPVLVTCNPKFNSMVAVFAIMHFHKLQCKELVGERRDPLFVLLLTEKLISLLDFTANTQDSLMK